MPQKGRISVHPRGFGFIELDSGDTAFVPPPELLWFLKGDRVQCEVISAADNRLTASSIKLVARDRHQVFGSIVDRKGRPHVRIDREISNADWPIAGDAPTLGAYVVASIEDRAVRIVRTIEPADASLERVLVRHEIREHHSEDALAEVPPPLTMEGRRDLRDVPAITIDAPSSRDLDDALSVFPAAPDGAIRLLVSIADVDALVPEGSALDREARTRGTSVYLAGRVIPMLPPKLSEDALSLLPNLDRPAMTAELRIDPEGRVHAVDVYASMIRSHARLDYEGVAAFLDDGDPRAIPEAVRDTVRWLRTAAARIAITRHARGGVSLLREEAYITLDERTREPTNINARENTSAHTLVERLMVAANEAVARWLVDRGLPGVFRVHDPPEPRKVESIAAWARNFGFAAGFGRELTPLALAAFEQQFENSKVAPAVNNVLGRALGPARYTVHPSIHFGLAAPLYLHFTSPIRRYADLAVHRIVKAFLAGRRDLHAGDAALESLAVRLNDLAFRATKAENERVRMLAARLFATKIGETFRGNVVSIKPFGAIVQLVGMAVTGTIEGGRYDVGESLDVRVVATNEDLGRIDLEPL